jgi:hypothetical protein
MPRIVAKSPGDSEPRDPISPMPLMSREEFDRRFKAVQREESRYALIMMAVFFTPLLVLVLFTQFYIKGQMPTWLQIATLIMLIAIIVTPIRLALKYFDQRPQRFGFICPNCNKPLRGFLVFRDFKYADCPHCHTLLAVE